MDSSRDSSVWRSLAVAFGDGLAFGVGMKLTHHAPGNAGASSAPDLAGRLGHVEQRLERIERAPAAISGSSKLDPRVVESLSRVLDARLQENAALTDRRLAEFDVNLALELKAAREQVETRASEAESRLAEIQKRLDNEIRALHRQINEDRNALRDQVVSLHREFASAVADIVHDQVATQMEERLGTLVEQRLVGLMREQLAPFEMELREEIRQSSAAKHREIADLRQRIVESDRRAFDVMTSTGELFRQAATRFGAVAPQVAVNSQPAQSVEPAPAAAESLAILHEALMESEPPPLPSEIPPEFRAETSKGAVMPDSDLPSFVRSRKTAAWSIPLVTSFLLTAGCVAILQYF